MRSLRAPLIFILRHFKSLLLVGPIAITIAMIALVGQVNAHASEQVLVLLLPTGFYISGGVAAVVLTILFLLFVPAQTAKSLFSSMTLWAVNENRGVVAASIISFFFLFCLVLAGWNGSHDPTRNALPLAIWSLFWVGLVFAQGLLGNIWKWLNPWTGPYAIACRLGSRPIARLPGWAGHWIGLASFLAFSAVLLAHPAPADPDRLALMVLSHWVLHFVGMIVFGSEWLRRAEGLSVLLNNYAKISLFGARKGNLKVGLIGWKTLASRLPSFSLAVFMITTLAIGSFDGLNETFWWFARIGINPLEFPGRSAVIGENLVGLALAVPALLGIYAVSIWMGLVLAGATLPFGRAFRAFAPAILPIALAYHFAHYLPSFLVEIQYVFRYIADALNLEPVRVTTGFFNTLATVQVIWLAQAGAVVLGHVVAILLSHVLALNLFGSHKKAIASQFPLASFMVAYTLFGLWLLAVPRGV